MSQKHAFGLAVRIVGLLVMLVAVLYFVSGIVLLVAPKYRPDVSPAWHYFLDGAIELIIGLYLLRGGSLLVRFAYPDERAAPPATPDA